ncbi:hypothetical protein [Catenibacterium mitsuokai]|uniref:hypothetical protein n=1 Tax=Catenibacterium mitsuokai TaxID=100886 RepID=UPI002591E103|nr:hypothetical protein [Catenibacterium mitsuokai]
MKDKFEPIPDPTEEDGFEGIYVVSTEDGEEEPLYDLRGLTKYLREHNLDQPTEEILKMFEM